MMQNMEIGKIGLSSNQFSENISNRYNYHSISTKFVPIIPTKRISPDQGGLELIFSFPFKFLNQKIISSFKMNVLKHVEPVFNLSLDLNFLFNYYNHNKILESKFREIKGFESLFKKYSMFLGYMKYWNPNGDDLSVKQRKIVQEYSKNLMIGKFLSFIDKYTDFTELLVNSSYSHLKNNFISNKNNKMIIKDTFVSNENIEPIFKYIFISDKNNNALFKDTFFISNKNSELILKDVFISDKSNNFSFKDYSSNRNIKTEFKDLAPFLSYNKSIKNLKFDDITTKLEKFIQGDSKEILDGTKIFLSLKNKLVVFNELLIHLNNENDFIFSKNHQYFFQKLKKHMKVVDHVSKIVMGDLKEIKGLKYQSSMNTSLLNPLTHKKVLLFSNDQEKHYYGLKEKKHLFYNYLRGFKPQNKDFTVLNGNLSIIQKPNFVYKVSSTIYKPIKDTIYSFKPIFMDNYDYFYMISDSNGIKSKKENYNLFQYDSNVSFKKTHEDVLELQKPAKYQLYPEIEHVKSTKTEIVKEKVIEKEIASKIQNETPKIPEIDINRLADTVYQLIERKMRIERERRGISL